MTGRVKKSIKAQMTLLVLSSAALILGFVETYSYVNTRQMILKTGQSIATHLTRSMTRRIEQEFRAVEKLPQSLSVFMSISPVRDTSKFKSLMVNLVHENPELFASGLFFEPTGEGRMTPGVTPYAFRKKDGIEYAQLAGSGYAYLEKQFYILPKVLNCPVWSDPYFDKGGGNIPMATYSVPLYRPGLRDKAQGFYGVATADISLKWLTEFTRSVRSGKTGFSFIITRTGLFVVHPDESLIHGESIFSLADKHNSSKLRAIARKMIREEQGFLPIGPVLAGEDAYLAWDEISCSGWILGTVVAKKELFRELDLLKQRSIGICIAGLVLLLGASLGVARSLSRPLVDMAATTRRIAKGTLEVDLSHIKRSDEIGVLANSIEDMAEGLRQKEFIKDTFGRYLTKEVVANLLESKDGLRLGGEAREITLMMSDLRGFTALTANMDPEKVISFLNRYLGKMVDILVAHKGVIDEIIGDGILAFFGAPEPMGDHTARAVACALDMQKAMAEINEANQKEGLARLEMGIAVHTGRVVVGNIGSKTRSKYGAVGSDVNFTGRMESYTVGGQVLVSQAVAAQLEGMIHIRQQLTVSMKGMPEPVHLFDVNGINGGIVLPEKRETITPLKSPRPVLVRRLNGKTIGSKRIQALLTRTSQTFAILEFSEPIGVWEDVHVTLARDPGEFYGKIVKVALIDETRWEARVRTTSLSAEAYPLF